MVLKTYDTFAKVFPFSFLLYERTPEFISIQRYFLFCYNLITIYICHSVTSQLTRLLLLLRRDCSRRSCCCLVN